jgi:osmotically inducible protein OsmC
MTKVLYTAHGTSYHGGRGRGEASTDDGKVAVKLSTPKVMGGDDGPGTNPEQLFALGYSACFLGAMGAAARKAGKKLPEESTVEAEINLADREDNVGLTIIAKLTAKVPGWSKDEVATIMTAAHDICPYSNLIRFAHDVELVAAE